MVIIGEIDIAADVEGGVLAACAGQVASDARTTTDGNIYTSPSSSPHSCTPPPQHRPVATACLPNPQSTQSCSTGADCQGDAGLGVGAITCLLVAALGLMALRRGMERREHEERRLGQAS